jgi:hypothetical protein
MPWFLGRPHALLLFLGADRVPSAAVLHNDPLMIDTDRDGAYQGDRCCGSWGNRAP